MQVPEVNPKPESQAEQADPLIHVVQPLGHEVHEEAPAAEKVPLAHAAQAAEPPVENWLAVHCVQVPELSPKPESQAVQAEPEVQVVQPEGHELQEAAPAAENEPLAHAAQVAEPPAEN